MRRVYCNGKENEFMKERRLHPRRQVVGREGKEELREKNLSSDRTLTTKEQQAQGRKPVLR